MGSTLVSGKHMGCVQEETLAVLATGVTVDNEDTGTVHVERRSVLLDCDIQRPKSPREGIVS